MKLEDGTLTIEVGEKGFVLPEGTEGKLVFIASKLYKEVVQKEFSFKNPKLREGIEKLQVVFDDENSIAVATGENFTDEKDYVVFLAKDDSVTQATREEVEDFQKSLLKDDEPVESAQSDFVFSKTYALYAAIVLFIIAVFYWMSYNTGQINSTKTSLSSKVEKAYVDTNLALKADKKAVNAELKAIKGSLTQQEKITKSLQEQVDVNKKHIAANKKAIANVNAKIAKMKKQYKKAIADVKKDYKSKMQQIVANQAVLIEDFCKPTFFFFSEEGCKDYLALKKIEQNKLDVQKAKLEQQMKAEINAIKNKYAKKISALEKEKGVYQIRPVKI